jgi:DNA polymerase-4
VSAEVFSIFRSFTPLVEGLSLDEAFLDVGGLRLHYESPVAVGEAVRSEIRAQVGLPASVGVASVKFVAKLASEAAKPDGLRHVPIEEQTAFLHALPASALWGVGPATLAALERLGVETVADVAGLPEAALASAVGPVTGRHLHELAQGRDPREVIPDIAAKSISVEETYDVDLVGTDVVETALLAHAQRLSSRLRRSGLRARTITLKVRFQDFTTQTRSHTVSRAVDGARPLFRLAVDLLESLPVSDHPVRLLGLSGAALEPRETPAQLGIEDGIEWERVEDAVARVREKFGDEAVGPARLAPTDPSSKSTPEP